MTINSTQPKQLLSVLNPLACLELISRSRIHTQYRLGCHLPRRFLAIDDISSLPYHPKQNLVDNFGCQRRCLRSRRLDRQTWRLAEFPRLRLLPYATSRARHWSSSVVSFLLCADGQDDTARRTSVEPFST